jgi:hypothetical protein
VRNYLDWLPFQEHTIQRAKRFLHEGEPFSLLDDNEKGILKKYHLLRNAVTHKSASAKAKFEAVIGNPALTPREKTPKGYLRVLTYGPGGLTQYQIAVIELQAIATKLCRWLRLVQQLHYNREQRPGCLLRGHGKEIRQS